jgi:hypothetical protein
VVGAIAGGVAGGLAGKEAAEYVDPTAEEAYWREEYPRRDYYAEEVDYDVIAPAYRMGWESHARYRDREWAEVEPTLREEWQKTDREVAWDRARRASQDAWERIERSEMEQRRRRGETAGP